MSTALPASLAGLPIAITGASSGIGRATALACAQAGMPVALGARRRDKLDTLITEILARQPGNRAIAIPMDVDKSDDCRRLIEAAVGEFGSLYAVFANAGYGFEKSFLQTTDAEIRAIYETNFFGTLNTIRPALEHMRRVGRGHILICSSSISKLGAPYFSAYSGSKAAQDHLARGLRIELAGTGIFVSSIHPVGTFMQSPEKVARAIVRCLKHPRGEIWTSTPARLGLALATAFPGVADKLLLRYARRRNRIIESLDVTPRV
jgi:NAD(P)-dependent dehydrogenase (short-subunit alcohol dehydrogenase family)